jgi:transposase InsO family protein
VTCLKFSRPLLPWLKDSGKKVKDLKNNSGGEYCSNEFEVFYKSHNIARKKTTPHTSEQNGVVERLN